LGTNVPTEIFGCKRCGAESAEAVAEYRNQFSLVAELVERSHFGLSILECPTCNQHWIYIFTETIDWTDGDDALFLTLLPITKSESDELQAQRANVDTKRIEQIGLNRRYLQINHPTRAGKKTCWGYGPLFIDPNN
jgi:hypothetical protein